MSEIRTTSDRLRQMGAEFVGTFAMVFAGCGAIVVNALSNASIGHGGICATFGLAVMVMIYATGHISGAHFNPAVTIAFAMVKRFSWRQVPEYIIAQIAAALVACLALQQLFPDAVSFGATVPSGPLLQSFVLEVILTFFLMFVITAVATDSRAVGHMAGLAIGSTVALCALFGGPVSGASMNPARSLGPALIQGNIENLWIYLTAPIIGAVLGAFIYQRVCCAPTEREKSDACC